MWNSPVYKSSGLLSTVATVSYVGIPHPTYSNSALEALGYTPWPYDPYTVPSDALPSPWNQNETGFHYVELNGTNGGNGYPADPAGSMPSSPSAGDVIVISDGGGSFGAVNETYTGTSTSPIFIVASGSPTFTGQFDVTGSDYLVIDGLTIDGTVQQQVLLSNSGAPSSYVCIRNCTIKSTFTTSSGSIVGVGSCDHFVAYNNDIEGGGVGNNSDNHGAKWTVGNDYWWINNFFHDISGDGLQIGDQANAANTINRMFIGGNEGTRCNQVCFWAKNCTDVIMSGNHAHDQGGGSSDGAMGAQYDFEWMWFLNNHCHDAESGIQIQGSGSGGGDGRYVIGNLIHDIIDATFDVDEPNTPSALGNRGGNSASYAAHFNTLHGNTGGFHCVGPEVTTFTHNIIGDPVNGSARHIYQTDGVASDGTFDYNYYEGSTQRIFWGSGTGNKTLSTFVADTAHEDNGISGTDPSFSDESNDIYSLQASSACVNAGDTSLPTAFATFESRYGFSIAYAFDSSIRPSTTILDIGAYDRASIMAAVGSSVITNSLTNLAGSDPGLVGRSNTLHWWNPYKNRWDGLIPQDDGDASGDHYLCKDLTSPSYEDEVEIRETSRPDCIFDVENKQVHIVGFQGTTTMYWRFLYNESTDDFTLQVGTTTTGETVTGITIDNTGWPGGFTVTPNGNVWVFSLTNSGVLVNMRTPSGSWNGSAVTLDATPNGGMCCSTYQVIGGKNNAWVFYAENDTNPTHTWGAFYIDENAADPFTAGSWTEWTTGWTKSDMDTAGSDNHASCVRLPNGNIAVVVKTDTTTNNETLIGVWEFAPDGTVTAHNDLNSYSGTQANRRSRPSITYGNKRVYVGWNTEVDTEIIGYYLSAPLDDLDDWTSETQIFNTSSDSYNDTRSPQSDFWCTSESGIMFVSERIIGGNSLPGDELHYVILAV